MSWQAVFPYQPSWLRWGGGLLGVLLAKFVSQFLDPLQLIDTGNIYIDLPLSFVASVTAGLVAIGVALSAFGHAWVRFRRERDAK